MTRRSAANAASSKRAWARLRALRELMAAKGYKLSPSGDWVRR